MEASTQRNASTKNLSTRQTMVRFTLPNDRLSNNHSKSSTKTKINDIQKYLHLRNKNLNNHWFDSLPLNEKYKRCQKALNKKSNPNFTIMLFDVLCKEAENIGVAPYTYIDFNIIMKQAIKKIDEVKKGFNEFTSNPKRSPLVASTEIVQISPFKIAPAVPEPPVVG
jgi:hypothetical protein